VALPAPDALTPLLLLPPSPLLLVFQAEVASGRLTSGSLDTYACVALAGVATEWLRFGRAEGGLADVQQLDRLLSALRFTQVGTGMGRGIGTGDGQLVVRLLSALRFTQVGFRILRADERF